MVFHYAPSRAHRHVHAILREYCGTLLSDGYEAHAAYAAYAAYAAQRPGEVTHALCWSHTRRGLERAKDSEPEAVAEALTLIGAMYAHEEKIRADALTVRPTPARSSRPSGAGAGSNAIVPSYCRLSLFGGFSQQDLTRNGF